MNESNTFWKYLQQHWEINLVLFLKFRRYFFFTRSVDITNQLTKSLIKKKRVMSKIRTQPNLKLKYFKLGFDQISRQIVTDLKGSVEYIWWIYTYLWMEISLFSLVKQFYTIILHLRRSGKYAKYKCAFIVYHWLLLAVVINNFFPDKVVKNRRISVRDYN